MANILSFYIIIGSWIDEFSPLAPRISEFAVLCIAGGWRELNHIEYPSARNLICSHSSSLQNSFHSLGAPSYLNTPGQPLMYCLQVFTDLFSYDVLGGVVGRGELPTGAFCSQDDVFRYPRVFRIFDRYRISQVYL